MTTEVLSRLESLEVKTDKIYEVLVELARVDERLTMLVSDGLAIQKRVKQLENSTAGRLDVLEKEVVARNAITARLEKLVWVLTAAVISLFARSVFHLITGGA